jgi:AraC family transcriptional regulator of adaptative response/methylated-DNA-[protein]-cysteine methyltransferase
MDRAVRRRDESYDGVFLVAVKTTGVFCRPSCASRPALARNRRYYPNPGAALAAGYRPCKRCRPLETTGKRPAWVTRLLARVDRAPNERLPDALMRELDVDPARARRYFKKHYGMSFQAFCRRRRMGEALQEIRDGSEITRVVYENGYQSDSGFREAFRKTFGRAPAQSRNARCIAVDWLESPVGPLVVAANDQGLCLLEFGHGGEMGTALASLAHELDCPIVPGKHPYIEQVRRELDEYFAGDRRDFSVPLLYSGTPFQRAAWEELRRIPYGETISYEEQARRIGLPGAQRAIGRANGQNRLAIIIPCHRVVNKSGQLGGYGGGLWRKQFLLELERGSHDLLSSR